MIRNFLADFMILMLIIGMISIPCHVVGIWLVKKTSKHE